MIALAFLAGLWTATLRARREKISGETIADVTLWLMVGGILGARIVYVATYWQEEFADQPLSEIFMIQHGGLVYYGGLIGAMIAGMIYIRWKKLPLWKTADVLAPSMRARKRLWPHRLPAQRLLLRSRVQPAVGDQFSGGQSAQPPDLSGSSDGNLRRAAEFRRLSFSRVAVPAQKIRRPDFRDLPALLRRHALVRGIFSRRLHQSALPPRPHARAMDQRADLRHRPCARGDPVAPQ